MTDDPRGAELVGALATIRSRIVTACRQAGRDPLDVTLIAVTKTRAATDVAALARLGVRDLGESKDQEARAKIAELTALSAPTGPTASPTLPAGLRWHLVGRLQTNKARSVATWAHAVHSVDRLKLVRSLADACTARPAPLHVFVQVSLDDDPARGGAAPAAVAGLADAVAARPELLLRGVMAVLPIGSDAGTAFARLQEISGSVQAVHPAANAISAGMSADFETALRHGATHVRVGTALLGRRPPVIG